MDQADETANQISRSALSGTVSEAEGFQTTTWSRQCSQKFRMAVLVVLVSYPKTKIQEQQIATGSGGKVERYGFRLVQRQSSMGRAIPAIETLQGENGALSW